MLSRQETKKLILETVIDAGWNDICKRKVLSFWTTFCCQNKISPDTFSYDTFLSEIYDDIKSLLSNEEKHLARFNELASFSTFDIFMSKNIV